MTDWIKAHVKKQSGKDHWTIDYVFSFGKSTVHIWKSTEECKLGAPFMVHAGASAEYADTFEKAVEVAIELTHHGVII